MIKPVSKVSQGWITESAASYMQFPGGEWHMQVEKAQGEIPQYALINASVRESLESDLVKAGMWVNWCHQLGVKATLLMPYLPAARADRGTPFEGAVYGSLINALGADEVIIFDGHSPIVPSIVQRCRNISPAALIKEYIARESKEYAAIIAPDKGAAQRAGEVATLLNIPLVQAEKARDFSTGHITHYDVERENIPTEGKLLVVDDICDGGRTFSILAESTQLPPERLSLWVSHGIFSGEAMKLRGSYGEIITTDSIQGYNPVATETLHLLPHLLKAAKG